MKTTLFEKYIEGGLMTMGELAEKLGYTPEYLSRVRHGHKPITCGFVARACLRLGHEIGELFYELPDPGEPRGGDDD